MIISKKKLFAKKLNVYSYKARDTPLQDIVSLEKRLHTEQSLLTLTHLIMFSCITEDEWHTIRKE